MNRVALHWLFIVITARMIHHSSESSIPVRSIAGFSKYPDIVYKMNDHEQSTKQATFMNVLHQTHDVWQCSHNRHGSHDNHAPLAPRVLQSTTGQEG
jgi:hypothetical protein